MGGGYKKMPMSGLSGPTKLAVTPKKASELPASVDWREKGAVTKPKNQGACGSCWAFATAAQMESYAAIATGNLPTLSTQQVTACAPNTLKCGGTGGCYGSIPQLGFTYLQLFGHVTESDYPYTAGGGNQGECEYDFSNMRPVVGITGYNALAPNDQDAVMTHLAEVGPLAVAVYASGWSRYSGGVYDGCDYDSNISINHAVQLVGYGTDASEETTGLLGTAGALAGERMDISGFKDRALLSVELIQVLWMELLVLEDLAMMNSMYVDNVEFFLMS